MAQMHSTYYDYNVGEAVKRYRLKLRGIQLIYIILAVAVIAWNFVNGSVPLFVKCILFIFITVVYRLVYPMQFQLLANVLFTDCDPYKFFEILTVLEGYDKGGKAKNTLLYYKAGCCAYMNNRIEEGLSYLKSVHFKKKDLAREAAILLMFANYAKLRNDRVSFDLIKKDIENLPNIIPHKENSKKQYDNTYKAFRVTELIWNQKDEEARGLIKELLQSSNISTLNKVIYNMHLARLDMMVL